LPPTLLPERWALTPPFHPYLRCVPLEDVPKVFLRAITGIRSTGGIFSVALSVMWPSRASSPGVTRRVAPTLLSQSGVRTFLPPNPLSQARPAIIQLTRRLYYSVFKTCKIWLSLWRLRRGHLIPSSFSYSPSVKIVTPNSFALSYFEPGSVPTTT
jgi:hypothetical protein